MKVKVNEAKNTNPIKYHITIVSNDKFYLYFSSIIVRKTILTHIKELWGAPNENISEFGINFMGEIWKVKTDRLLRRIIGEMNIKGENNYEMKIEDGINFERVERLYYEDSNSPRLKYMVGILEECINLEKA